MGRNYNNTEREKEMARIEIDMFSMYMGELAAYFQTEVSEEVIKKDYWPHYKYLDTKIIIKIIQWLKDNYSFGGFNKNPRFPLKRDFDSARMNVMRKITPEYTPDPHRRDPNYSTCMNRVLWGFKMMDKIRHIEIPGCDKMSALKVCNIIQEFWKKMRSAGKVFSLSTNKWIDKKNALTGEYFDPCEFGLGI